MKKVLKRYVVAFSLTEAMVMMIITGVLIIAAFPLVNISKNFKDYDLATVNCVRSESAASFSSTACSNTINAARYNQGKALKTLIFFADHGKDITEQEAARKVLRQVCDLSGNKACKYFADTCKKDSSGCDITGSEYDLRYYLALFTNDTNDGRFYISDFLQGYYNLGYKNIVTEVDFVCCNPDFNTACVVKGLTACPPRDARFIGRITGDYAGISVGLAGDVNNDGYDDILIGSHSAAEGGYAAGETYLIMGRDNADWNTLIGTGNVYMNQTLGWANRTVRFIGRVSYDYSGRAVNSAGDVNNDGYDDILIGAYGADGGGSASGEAYLILGRSNAAWSTLTGGTGNFNLDNLSWTNNTVRFIGRLASDNLGTAVSSSGDVNNDGYDDILIGAHLTDNAGTDSGEAYLILGRSNADWTTLAGTGNVYLNQTLSWSNSMMRFIGMKTYDYVGRSVSTAGDVNNDSYADILISGDGADSGGANSGEAYVILGRSNADWTTLAGTGNVYLNQTLTWSNSMMRFIGRVAQDYTGYSVSTAKDTNNDGYDDILLGAYGGDGWGTYSGDAFLIMGRSNTDWGTLSGTGNVYLNQTTWTNSVVRFVGRSTYDYAGFSVSTAGDVNNDSYADILIGAYAGEAAGSETGEAFLVLGRNNADWGTQASSGRFRLAYYSWANRTIRIVGRAANDRSGYSLSLLEDANGDGYDDILIGAYQGDAGGTQAGESYLIWGRRTADWSTIGDNYFCNATWP